MFPGHCGDIEEARIAGVSESADALEGGGGVGVVAAWSPTDHHVPASN